MTMPAIEGAWFGPDKVAHFLVPVAVTGWIIVFRPRAYAWGPILGVLAGMAWEASNWWYVFEGSTGVSLLDAMAFMAGGLASGVLALVAYRRCSHAS
jgi:hypothetical protein